MPGPEFVEEVSRILHASAPGKSGVTAHNNGGDFRYASKINAVPDKLHAVEISTANLIEGITV